MSKTRKILLIFFLIAAALAVVYSVYNSQKKPVSFDNTIQALEKFEPKNQMSDPERDQYRKNFDEAVQKLESGKAIQKNQPSLTGALYSPLLSIGSVHRDIGDYTKAEVAFTLARDLQPAAFVPYANLADMYFRFMHDCKKAEPYYLKVVEFKDATGYLSTAYIDLFNLYRSCYKDESKAEQILIAGVTRYPTELDILSQLAFYYRETGQTEKAITRYHELLSKNPNSELAKQALKDLGAL